MNTILNTDSYKMSHFAGYPLNTTYMYSYLESRGGAYDELVFQGLQPILNVLERRLTKEDCVKGGIFAPLHGVPYNEAGWDYILNECGGKLPIEIRAVKEGTIVPAHEVMMTIKNTDPKCAWLTSYLETMLLRIWYPITVSTRIWNMKKRIKVFFEQTADNMDNLPFALLDFSARGCSSLESAQIGGSAYLAHFMGSDNVAAVDFTNENYDSDMSGFSVPATEHTIMCAYGEENEFDSFGQLIERMGIPGHVLSVVSDTWDIFRACDYWCLLVDKIRAKNMTLVVRPDSGEIEDVFPRVLEKLEAGFGYTMNSKGYKVLNNVKVLWGDGINEHTHTLPFEIAKAMSISADSIMTGSGGGLMQSNIDRDTCKFAIKGSNVTVDGVSIPIAKSPITDPGKKSKKGMFALVERNGKPTTIDLFEKNAYEKDMLELVYRNGEIIYNETIDTIRKRINEHG